MIGGSSGGQGVDISKYLVNFNSSDWANAANQYITSALNQGINQSTKYNQAAIDASQAYQNQANQALNQGYNMSQALTTPQRIATYGALDAYSDSLGLARPTQGGYQLATQLENQARGPQQMPGLFSQVSMPGPVNPPIYADRGTIPNQTPTQMPNNMPWLDRGIIPQGNR